MKPPLAKPQFVLVSCNGPLMFMRRKSAPCETAHCRTVGELMVMFSSDRQKLSVTLPLLSVRLAVR